DAGLLAYDPVARTAYVADRRGDRVAVVTVAPGALALARAWATPVEPYGVALAPDRATLLVTTIADRALVGAEPRGVAISPDGTRAMIAYLATGAVDEIALGGSHAITHVALPAPFNRQIARGAFTAAFLGDDLAVVPFQRDAPGDAQIPGDGDRYGGSFDPPI